MPGDGVRGAEPGLSPAPFPVDPSLSPSPAASPPAPGTELSYLNGTFRLLQKPLRWHDALLLCESRNASLAHVLDPYTQAFLTQAARGLRTPLWIGLASEEVGTGRGPPTPSSLSSPNPLPSVATPLHPALAGPLASILMAPCAQGSRRYSWVSEEPLSYVSWQDGEPQLPGGCAYVDTDGTWRTTICDTKLQGAVCGVHGGECPPAGARAGPGRSRPQEDPGTLPQCCTSPLTGPPPPRRISYHGSCPQGLADSAWIPFREHCYSFHMELLLGHKEALQRCQRGGLGGRAPPPGRSGWRPLSRMLRDPTNVVPVPHSACRLHSPLSAPHGPIHTDHLGRGMDVNVAPRYTHVSTPSSTQAAREKGGASPGALLPTRRLTCPDVGLLYVQRAARSCPSWMRWRTCLSGSICRALRARVGAPGWA